MSILTKEFDDRSQLELSGLSFNDYKTPCIYAWKREDTWLYIGASKCGFSRVFNNKHHIFNKLGVRDTDKILIWFFNNLTVQELFNFEALLISEYKPLYNTMMPQGPNSRKR